MSLTNVNKLKAISLLASLTAVGFGQDCTTLLTGRKRFIFDDVQSIYNNLPKEVRHELPANTEVNAKCRFDLTTLQNDQKQTLKQLYNTGYHLCVGCGYRNNDYGNCHSIDVCQKGSVCIQARNRDKSPAPSYYWHGCCDPADSKCTSGDDQIHFNVFGRDVTMHYIKTRCDGPICNENGYQQLKTDLISFLTNNSSAPLTTTTSAPSSLPVDGGWTEWGAWSSCDKTCDLGLNYRNRACTNPVPKNGGQSCSGIDKQTEFCNAFSC